MCKASITQHCNIYDLTFGVNGAKNRNILLNSFGRATRKLYGWILIGMVKFAYFLYRLLTVTAIAANKTLSFCTASKTSVGIFDVRR